MKPITKKVIEFKKLILNLEGSERSTFFKDLNSYVYLLKVKKQFQKTLNMPMQHLEAL